MALSLRGIGGTVVFLYAIHTCLTINVPLNIYREIDKCLHNAPVRSIRTGTWISFIAHVKQKPPRVNDTKSDKNLSKRVHYSFRLGISFKKNVNICLDKNFELPEILKKRF